MTILNVQIRDNLSTTNNYVEVSKMSESGVKFGTYKMTLDDFVRAIQGSTTIVEERKEETFQPLPSPILFERAFKHSWIEYDYESNTGLQQVYVEIPKSRWDVTIFDTRLMNVGFPRMIFRYTLDESLVIRKLSVFAIKDGVRIDERTELYEFPFSNVSSDGQVCMGGNVFPPIDSCKQLETMHNYFFQVPFSLDYYGNGRNRNLSGISDIRGLFTTLVDKDFPEEWLRDSYLPLWKF